MIMDLTPPQVESAVRELLMEGSSLDTDHVHIAHEFDKPVRQSEVYASFYVMDDRQEGWQTKGWKATDTENIEGTRLNRVAYISVTWRRDGARQAADRFVNWHPTTKAVELERQKGVLVHLDSPVRPVSWLSDKDWEEQVELDIKVDYQTASSYDVGWMAEIGPVTTTLET